jgi:hypothetical protein
LERTFDLIRAACERDIGSRQQRVFRQAGLPWPDMIVHARVSGGSHSAVYDYLARTLGNLVAEKAGLAKAEDVEIQTLADRLREQAVARELVVYPPRLVGAWVRAGCIIRFRFA